MIKHQEDYESLGGDKLPEDFLTGLLFKKLAGYEQAKNAVLNMAIGKVKDWCFSHHKD